MIWCWRWRWPRGWASIAPGPDRRDSFFARTHNSQESLCSAAAPWTSSRRPARTAATRSSPARTSPQESHARLYLGVAAQGRSLKVILLRIYLALLGAAQKWYVGQRRQEEQGQPGRPVHDAAGLLQQPARAGRQPAHHRGRGQHPAHRLRSNRKREGETDGLFADRKIATSVVELTSRVSTDKVAEAKRRLALPFHDDDRVDVAIATNMISVGLDITRLGLMVVLGQPKTSAEYIQATSRVGRDPDKPGLVVTILNVHRPRDRSHYERFAFYHESFYRSVEATSVTPFSPRALDRGLAGTLVALARQGHAPMTPPKGATEILQRARQAGLRGRRPGASGPPTTHETPPGSRRHSRQRCASGPSTCSTSGRRSPTSCRTRASQLQYQSESGAAQRLLYEFLNPELKKLPQRHRKFRANRSMRDVEPSVNLWVKTLDNIDVEDEE